MQHGKQQEHGWKKEMGVSFGGEGIPLSEVANETDEFSGTEGGGGKKKGESVSE